MDVVVAFVPIVLSFVLVWLAPREWLAYPVAAWIMQALMTAWLIGYPWWIRRRRGERMGAARPGGFSIVRELLFGVVGFAAVLMTATAGAAIVLFVSGVPAEPDAVRELVTRSRGPNFVLLIVYACLIGPIAEEIFFRGYLYRELRTWLNGFWAVLGQAVLFALFHGDTSRLPYFLLIGLTLQGLYAWRRTLLTPIVGHCLFNTAFTLFVLYSASLPKPLLGVNAEPNGPTCKVSIVSPGSAAADAGVLVGDVIVAVDGNEIENMRDLVTRIRELEIGQQVRIELLRDGETIVLEAVLGSTADRAPPPPSEPTDD